MDAFAESLKNVLGARLRVDFPLAVMTTFGIGGPVDYFASVNNRQELEQTILLAKRSKIQVTLIGAGSNILVADSGFRGLAVHLDGDFKELSFGGDGKVSAGAGLRLGQFVKTLAEKGYQGMESLAGIPGTVGGAIFMNAGTAEGETKDYLTGVTVFSMKRECWQEIAVDAQDFSYRSSPFQKGSDIIAAGVFNFPQTSSGEMAAEKIQSLLERRRKTQPVELKSAGSFFKNPKGDYAARLIEAAGLKGLSVGDAELSTKHAGFIVNKGHATAKDVLTLVKKVQAEVARRFNVRLEPEVRLLGEF